MGPGYGSAGDRLQHQIDSKMIAASFGSLAHIYAEYVPAASGYIKEDFCICLELVPASSVSLLCSGLDQGMSIADKIRSEHCAYQRSFLESRSTNYSSIADLQRPEVGRLARLRGIRHRLRLVLHIKKVRDFSIIADRQPVCSCTIQGMYLNLGDLRQLSDGMNL